MAWLTVPALIGPVLGPPLGGFITTYLNWRWIFWINVPIGVLGIVLVSLFIPDLREERSPPLDLLGFLLSAVGLVGLVFGFETIGRGLVPWSTTLLLLAIGVVGIGLYVLHASRTLYPVIDLALLGIPTFRASVLGGLLFRIAIGATPFLLPLMLQVGFGLSPFNSGLLTFAAAAGAMLMKLTAGPILKLFGFKRVLMANALIGAVFIARDRPVHATHAASLDPGRAAGRRLLPLAPVHQHQHARLRRHRARPDEPGDQLRFSMMQQLSLSIGVGTGALLLHLTVAARGGEHLAAGDFAPAFFAVGCLAALSALVYLPLAPDAGAEVSGRAPLLAKPASSGKT